MTASSNWRRAAGAGALVLSGLFGVVALSPVSQAQPNCPPGSINPMCGVQAGDLVLPASGGPPEIAAAPAPPGAPVITTGGGPPVITAGPPIG
ncbi:MAG: hypothetical protein K0U78_15470 [Actinomycetia bacterium]|nr:hypothetical protein [Actinomycetes bacterium]